MVGSILFEAYERTYSFSTERMYFPFFNNVNDLISADRLFTKPGVIMLDLSGPTVKKNDFIKLSNFLNNKSSFSFFLILKNGNGKKYLKQLVACFQRLTVPLTGLRLELQNNNFIADDMKTLQSLFISTIVPQYFALFLSDNSIESGGVKILLKRFHWQCPKGIFLCLQKNNLTADSLKWIADWLQGVSELESGEYGVELSNNELTDLALVNVAAALREKKIPNQTSIMLNTIGCNGIALKYVCSALSAQNAPQGFKLFLGGNQLINEAFDSLSKLLETGYPAGLYIILSNTGLTTNTLIQFSDALFKCHSKKPLGLGFSENSFSVHAIVSFMMLISAGFPLVYLEFDRLNLEGDGKEKLLAVRSIIQALLTPGPQLMISLQGNNLGPFVYELFKKVNLMQRELCIDLEKNGISQESMYTLLTGCAQKPWCVSKLHLKLGGNHTDTNIGLGIISLLEKKPNCTNLILNLKTYSLGNEGFSPDIIKKIAYIVKRKGSPQGFRFVPPTDFNAENLLSETAVLFTALLDNDRKHMIRSAVVSWLPLVQMRRQGKGPVLSFGLLHAIISWIFEGDCRDHKTLSMFMTMQQLAPRVLYKNTMLAAATSYLKRRSGTTELGKKFFIDLKLEIHVAVAQSSKLHMQLKKVLESVSDCLRLYAFLHLSCEFQANSILSWLVKHDPFSRNLQHIKPANLQKILLPEVIEIKAPQEAAEELMFRLRH